MNTLALVLITALPAGSPETAVSDAVRDARRLPAAEAKDTHYLSRYHDGEKESLDRWDRILRIVANLLSTEVTLTPPRRVRADLWAVRLSDYGPAWSVAWEKLIEQESFFHIKALLPDLEEYTTQEYGYWRDGIGRQVSRGTPGAVWVTTRTERVKVRKSALKEQVAAAPWLDAREIADLIRLTGSAVPIVRADEWLWVVMAQEGRKVGYYDFTGAPNTAAEWLKQYEVNLKGAKRLKQERRTFVTRSIVVHNFRELEWYRGILDLFATNDFARSTDVKNAARLLDGDAEPDAHEYYLRSPNGLWLWYLANGAGARVNFAPDNIGSNGAAPGTDRRIHVGIACFQCHKEGLQPVKDQPIVVYQPPFSLDALDPEKQRRLRDVYLKPMQREIARHNEEYSVVLKGLTGWAPEEASKAVAKAYWDYEVDDRDLAATAAEVGLTEQEWQKRLKVAARQERKLDPVLLALLQGIPARYDQWAEVFPNAMAIARAP